MLKESYTSAFYIQYSLFRVHIPDAYLYSMNDQAKIQLSAAEMELVQNAEILLTKNAIINKVYGLFGQVAELVRGEWGPSPKISRGENYLGLPWVMLDYPRIFSKEDTLAVRVFFWWGNFFSITLHCKGSYLQQHQQNILNNLPLLEKYGFYVCISNDEWRHEFTVDNYVPVAEVGHTTLKEVLHAGPFCKLSVRIPLDQWSRVKILLVELYEVIYSITGNQLPSR